MAQSNGRKKLEINRTTLVNLSDSGADQVRGGVLNMDGSGNCTGTASGGGMCTSGTYVVLSCCSWICSI